MYLIVDNLNLDESDSALINKHEKNIDIKIIKYYNRENDE